MSIDWIRRSREMTFRVRNFIDGAWSEVGGTPLDKYAPRDGQLLGRFGAGADADVDRAVAAARCAFEDGRWSQLSVVRRKEILCRFAALIESHREELALAESVDVGKPIGGALNFDVPVTAAVIRHHAEMAEHLYGDVYNANQSNLSYQLRTPLGVVAAIVGWNFPLALAAQKIGPALATGNALVLKPSELTSLSTARLAELAIEAGVPSGVFNVVHGDSRIGAALGAHHTVDMVTFTGSSVIGKRLLMAAGQSNMKRLVLECGGKAPNIVFEDCPRLEAVAEAIVSRAFWNQGQVCTASSRLLVQESVKDELLRLVVRKAAELAPADPLQADTRFGALASREHKRKVLGYVESGMQQGATLAYQCASSPPFVDGFYVAPVIFSDVFAHHTIAQEEIFGPVLSVISFRDEKEAIRIANSTIYGLSAIVWTKDLGRAHRMTRGVRAGSITVNATEKSLDGPAFGEIPTGGHKQSGFGLEGGFEGLAAYMNHTAVQLFV